MRGDFPDLKAGQCGLTDLPPNYLLGQSLAPPPTYHVLASLPFYVCMRMYERREKEAESVRESSLFFRNLSRHDSLH